MREIFAGLMLAAALAAVVTSTASDGQGDDARIPDRREVWNDLRNRPDAPRIHDARFVGPRSMPITVNSPAVLLEPAKRFADAITAFAGDVGAAAGPELGVPWLTAKAVGPDGDGSARANARRRGAPLPMPRPDRARQTQGVLSAALRLLEKAGVDALSHAGRARPGEAPAPAEADVSDRGPALPASHPDRAPGRPI